MTERDWNATTVPKTVATHQTEAETETTIPDYSQTPYESLERELNTESALNNHGRCVAILEQMIRRCPVEGHKKALGKERDEFARQVKHERGLWRRLPFVGGW